jgi:hypothetical protein
LVAFSFLAHKDFKYEWTDFLKDINTYKTVGFVLATTLLPNVLSDIQVGHAHGERKNLGSLVQIK